MYSTYTCTCIVLSIVLHAVKITVQPRDVHSEIGSTAYLQCCAEVIGSSSGKEKIE